ncbi:MAG: hypothetical protein GC145_03805 [Caulobacter sp.]|nr:hypothetical protein [Caulobacter sp.]
MRRLALVVLMLLLASPVAARQQRLTAEDGAGAARAGLRASQDKTAPEPPPPLDFSVPGGTSTLPASLAFTRPLVSTSGGAPKTGNGSQCRTSCAQSHYFCLAAEDEQTCNPQWSRCVAGCS